MGVAAQDGPSQGAVSAWSWPCGAACVAHCLGVHGGHASSAAPESHAGEVSGREQGTPRTALLSSGCQRGFLCC